MQLSEKIKYWFKKFQRVKVTFKDGFFHLSSLANSPEIIIESFDKMPFVKHNKEKKLITSNTTFLNVELYYSKLEDGLWIIVSNMLIKKNFVLHNIFEDELPVNYNCLNLHYNKKSVSSKSVVLEGMVITDKTFTLFKAGYLRDVYHFKDVQASSITVYYTDEWLLKKYKNSNLIEGSNFAKFINSNNKFIFITDTNLESDAFFNAFYQEINSSCNNENLTSKVKTLFDHFINKYNTETIYDNHFKVADRDRKHIQKTEKYLTDNLFSSFPGIEAIADFVGVSPTKIKSDFKLVHNKSIYKYYSYHQMQLAKKLITEKNMKIKEVAQLFGYENASKFSAAFKNQFGINPSSLQS